MNIDTLTKTNHIKVMPNSKVPIRPTWARSLG